MLECCEIGIFFLDSLNAEGLTLPKFLASPSVCSFYLDLVHPWLLPLSLQFFLLCSTVTELLLLFSLGLALPPFTLFCHLVIAHN